MVLHHHPPQSSTTMAAISLPSVQPSFTGDSSSSTAGNGQLPTTPPASPPPATSIAVNEEEDDAVVVLIDTHHRRASRRAIRAIHHDEDDAHISDLLRAQADVDHRGHTRRVFLAHHQRIQLHPAPIVVHFKSQPMHILIHIFMDHFVGFDSKINHHKGHPDRFLLELIRPSIFSKAAASIAASISRPHHLAVNAQAACQHLHPAKAHPATSSSPSSHASTAMIEPITTVRPCQQIHGRQFRPTHHAHHVGHHMAASTLANSVQYSPARSSRPSIKIHDADHSSPCGN